MVATQIFFIFNPCLGKIPILTTVIFFRWVETTNLFFDMTEATRHEHTTQFHLRSCSPGYFGGYVVFDLFTCYGIHHQSVGQFVETCSNPFETHTLVVRCVYMTLLLRGVSERLSCAVAKVCQSKCYSSRRNCGP